MLRKCNLQLRRRAVQELSSTTSDSELARVHDGHLEDDLVALLPGLGLEGLAWQDGAGEANLDVLDWSVFES
jgi:hypothetical protein